MVGPACRNYLTESGASEGPSSPQLLEALGLVAA